jgi:hypothetical protein
MLGRPGGAADNPNVANSIVSGRTRQTTKAIARVRRAFRAERV